MERPRQQQAQSLIQLDNSRMRSSYEPQMPIKNTEEIGRNEKVTVKYSDGTIKKDVKYKKAMRDLEAGKCELA